MLKVSKIAIAAALTAAAIATPALAQSFDPEVGTGNVISFSYGSITLQNPQMGALHAAPARVARQRSGLNAFAMVAPTSAGGDLFDPALTGGGSRGYNENLRRDF